TAVATETAVGSGVYTASVTLSWAQLLDFGLSDVGVYRIAVKATNGDGYSTTAFADVTVQYTQPVVTLTGPTSTTVGSQVTVDFSAVWPTPADSAKGWIIDWGDGTTDTLGSTATSDTHIYLTTGVAAITATVFDKDNSKLKPPGQVSNTLSLPVGLPSVDPGGPYEIAEGDSL